MTRIDFHLNIDNPLHYACRLVRKAYNSGLKVVCYSTQAEVLKSLDELLWTFSEDDFLPHGVHGDAQLSQCPIVLTHLAEDLVHYDLLVNLDEQWPPFFSRFERLIEIVGNEESSKALARQRYKFYKDRGYPLQMHNRSETAA